MGVLRTARLDPNVAGQRRPIVLGAAIALFAAGLSPMIYGLSSPTLEGSARQQPDLQAMFLLFTVAIGGVYLVGGLVGDLYGLRRTMLAGLLLIIVSNLASGLAETSPGLFALARLAAAGGMGLVIPAGIAMVAAPFEGETRAITIGIGYAALGIGAGAADFILVNLSPRVGFWPSLWLVAILAVFAAWYVRRTVPADVPQPPIALAHVTAYALWIFGLLAVTTALIGVAGRADLAMAALGTVGAASMFAGTLLHWRRPVANPDARVDLRPLAFALIAGVILAFGQVVPMLTLSKYLLLVSGAGELVAGLAIGPLILGFLAGGGVAGWLSSRFSARGLISGSLIAVGLSSFAVAAILAFLPNLLLVAPLLLIGVAYIVGTAIRAMLIFASIPRRLPALAAGLNQTSIVMGSQLGILIASSIVGVTTLAAFEASASRLQPAELQASLAQLSELMQAIGTTYFAPLVTEVAEALRVEYRAAFGAGIIAAFLASGTLSLIGAVISFLGIPRAEPLVLRWHYREERPERDAPPAAS
jgi:MFS transporter, DHA2 family, methylenomycin A resistance protein